MNSMGNETFPNEPSAGGSRAWHTVYLSFAGFYAVLNAVGVWFGRWLMSGQWPSTMKLILCSILGAAGLLAFAVVLRARTKRDESGRNAGVIPGVHVLGILAILFAESIFATWVIWGPG